MPLKILNDQLDKAFLLKKWLYDVLEPNSSLVTSNIKGLLVGDLFWLYHRLLYANAVKETHPQQQMTNQKKKRKINSDKVHKCSFKKQSGTNKYIHQESFHTHTHTRAQTFKWVRQLVHMSKSKTSQVCVKHWSSHVTHTRTNQ